MLWPDSLEQRSRRNQEESGEEGQKRAELRLTSNLRQSPQRRLLSNLAEHLDITYVSQVASTWSYPAPALGTEAASGSADRTVPGAAGAHRGRQCLSQQSRAWRTQLSSQRICCKLSAQRNSNQKQSRRKESAPGLLSPGFTLCTGTWEAKISSKKNIKEVMSKLFNRIHHLRVPANATHKSGASLMLLSLCVTESQFSLFSTAITLNPVSHFTSLVENNLNSQGIKVIGFQTKGRTLNQGSVSYIILLHARRCGKEINLKQIYSLDYLDFYVKIGRIIMSLINLLFLVAEIKTLQ